MHGRSLPVRGSPVRVRQWLILHDEWDSPDFDQWLASKGGNRESREITGQSDGCDVIWQRHNEFSTVTAVRPGKDVRASIAHVAWLEGVPGKVFRSVEILVGEREDFADTEEYTFDKTRLVSSYVFDRTARIWTDFTIKSNGSGRIFVEDLGLRNDETTRLVQTLIEIGNYRKLALLGFPLARELMPWITEVESQHVVATERHNSGEARSGDVLTELLALSARIEMRASLVRFRLGATGSYHLLTSDRLRSLRETRIEGFSTAAEFVERRLLPAMRTCEAAQRRLEHLSERITRTASLLSLEQTMMLNKRNQAILASLNRRSALQLRLQNLVEGFSIFAISYYIISILEKLLKAAGHVVGSGDHLDQNIGLLVIPVVLTSWIVLKRGKKRSRRT